MLTAKAHAKVTDVRVNKEIMDTVPGGIMTAAMRVTSAMGINPTPYNTMLTNVPGPIREAHERALHQLREEIAQEAAEGIREAVLVARKSLRGEAPVDAKSAAAILRALATVDTSLDKIGRLDAGSPTEITEDRRSDDELVRDIERALADPAMQAAMERRIAEREE